MSDIHVDFGYEVGGPNKCTFPICCRNNGPSDLKTKIKASPAGKWGDYKCDVPHHTMKNMFDYIGDHLDEMKVDFITWVGDNGPHNIWLYSKEEVADYTRNVTSTLKESLKNHPNV